MTAGQLLVLVIIGLTLLAFGPLPALILAAVVLVASVVAS